MSKETLKMTNEQTLEYLRIMAILNGNETPLEGIEQIKKDLEILEIIKKWSFIQDNYKEGYGTFTQFLCNIHTIGMKEDFEKVKEWMDNE